MNYIDHNDINIGNIKQVISFAANVLRNPNNVSQYTTKDYFNNLNDIETKSMKGNIGLTPMSTHKSKLNNIMKGTCNDHDQFCILVKVKSKVDGRDYPVAIGYNSGKKFTIDFNNVFNGCKPSKIFIDSKWKPFQRFVDGHVRGHIEEIGSLMAFIRPHNKFQTNSFEFNGTSKKTTKNSGFVNDPDKYVKETSNNIFVPKINPKTNIFSQTNNNNNDDSDSDESFVDEDEELDDIDNVDGDSDEDDIQVNQNAKITKKSDVSKSRRNRNNME